MMDRTLGLIEISKDSPQGSDVRYDDSFLVLQAEIDKLASPADRNSFSWQTVADKASDILLHHSKDLLVASYLAVALIYLEKANGFEKALVIYHDILTRYWDVLFPPVKRMKGRMAALDWWVERTERAVDELGIKAENNETAKQIIEKLIAIDGFLSKNLKEPPNLLSMIRKAESWQAAETPVKQPSTPQTPTSSNDPVDLQSVSLSSSDDIMKTLTPLFLKIKQASVALREEKDSNPQAYRWLRFAIWEPVKSLPPADNGKTRIPQPEIQVLARLSSLMADEDWKGVLETAESALFTSRNLFLLDLNYYSWEALSNMGKKYENARNAVQSETIGFINRFKGLEYLLFSDGTPFASNATKNWLNSFHNNTDMNVYGNNRSGENKFLNEMDEIAKIKELPKPEGSLADHAALIQDRINSSPSGKMAMLLRLELARILLAGKQEKMASLQLEQVVITLSEHRLVDWEPELALSTLQTVFRYFRTNQDSRYKLMAQDVLSMIAKIDVSEAIRIQ